MALSDVQIRKAKNRDKAYKLSDGGGLFLLVKPNGSRLWQQKYRFHGKERLLSHGQYPDVSLAQARSKRDDARALLADGNDPSVQKRLDQIDAETQARTTFLLIAEEYLEQSRERDLADATMRKKDWQIQTLAEPLHHRPISEITSAEVLHLLKKIERSGRRETAKKLLGTLSAIFRLAVVTLRAETDPTYAVKGALLPPKRVSRAAITDEATFGALLRDMEAFTGWRVAALPAEKARWLGTFDGTWGGTCTGSLQVHRIDGDEAAVTYTWGFCGNSNKGSIDRTAKFDGEALYVELLWGREATYTFIDANTIEGYYQSNRVGSSGTGRFTRVEGS